MENVSKMHKDEISDISIGMSVNTNQGGRNKADTPMDTIALHTNINQQLINENSMMSGWSDINQSQISAISNSQGISNHIKNLNQQTGGPKGKPQ